MKPLLIAAPLALALSLRAAAADEPLPLRHLEFSASVGNVTEKQSTRSTAMSTGGDSHSSMMSGGSDYQTSRSNQRVAIVVDVIGMLAQNDGLAVMVAESGDRKSAPARVDVLGDGTVIVPPAQRETVTPEEIEIAGLCARGLLIGHTIEAGESWQQDAGDGRLKEHSTYRIVSQDGDTLKLEIVRDLRGTAIGAVDRHSVSTIVYAPKRSVPLHAVIARRSHSGGSLNPVTTDESFEYQLARDSFVK